MRSTVINALDKLLASGQIEQAIEKQVLETVSKTIADELRPYSEFGKRVGEAVRKALALHGDIDVPSYNAAILQIVQRAVESQTRASIEQQVAAQMKELLSPAPESITLTALVRAYIEHLNERRRGGCVCYGDREEITCVVEQSDYGYQEIGLDAASGKQRNRCEIQIGITKDGRVYHLRFQDQDVEKKLFAGPFYNFERLLFQMKAAGTTIKIDANPHDLDLELAAVNEG